MTDDELDDLLRPRDVDREADFRERLRARTSAGLRASRWPSVRRVASLAASFLAGMAVLWFVDPRPTPLRVREVLVIREVPEVAPPPESEPEPRSAYEWELLAEQTDGPDSSRYFRKAGDLYLADEADYDAAMRCYRLFLKLTPRAEWDDPAGGDTWLLVALKRARTSEVYDENPSG